MSKLEKRLAAAQKLVTTGDSQQAAEAYDAILNEDPGQPEALRMRGLAALQLGQVNIALDYLQRAAQADPSSPLPWDHMAEAFALLEQPEQVIAACQEAIKRAPDMPEPRVRLGTMLQRYRRLKPARIAAEKALELDPSAPGAQQLYGGVLCELGEFSEAARILLEARRGAEPLADPNAWLFKSLIALGEGDALSELPPAREPRQRYVETVLNCLRAWTRGEFDAAEQLLDRAQSLGKQIAERDRTWSQQKLLEGLLANRKLRPELYEPVVDETIPVVGDNLAAGMSGLLVTPGGEARRLDAHPLVFGRFRRIGGNAFPAADAELGALLDRLSHTGEIVFAFGETNFRRGAKVLPNIRVEGDARALEQLTTFARRTVTELAQKSRDHGLRAAICTLPHEVMVEGLAEDDRRFLDQAVRHVNEEIARFAEAEEMRVVDLYAATSKADGAADRSLYFFENYPRPTVLAKALAKAFS